jgi:hypothetical protein
MAYQLIKAQLPYRQAFLRPRRRRIEYGWFCHEEHVSIDIVDPEAAPAAYEVRLAAEADGRTPTYRILSYDDRLWWPLGGGCGRALHHESFAFMLEKSIAQALIAFAPSFANCTARRPLNPIPREYELVDDNFNSLGDCLSHAQRGASETIICAGRVFVKAGEPIFYAVPDENDPRLCALHIGISDEDREGGGTELSEPGPARSDRRTIARRGHAFGIDELDEGLNAMRERGYRLQRCCEVDVLIEKHRTETAPLLCARELADFLFEASLGIDRKADGLRDSVPVIRAADSAHEVRQLSVTTLEQFRSSNDPVVAYEFFPERRAAEAILKRLNSLGCGTTFDPADEAAMATLGAG